MLQHNLFTYLNNKTLSHVLKIFNYDGIWENKKLSDENQRFDWIKLIHSYRLVNIGCLADMDLFDSVKERKHCGRTWLIRAQALQIL